jgi:predicted TIM-barrel fold metal-dependent hydrolase
MIIDNHAHVGSQEIEDSDFRSPSEQIRYLQRNLALDLSHGRETRRVDDDCVVEEGWKTLWNENLWGSWEGMYDVRLTQIHMGKELSEGSRYVWEKDGVEYYTPLYIDPIEWGHAADAPAEYLISLMDRVGVDKAVLQWPQMGLRKYFSEIMRKYPGRFIGLCYVEESRAYAKENIGNLRSNIEDLGLRGLYYDPLPGWEGYEDFHADKYDPFWSEVSSLGIPVYACGNYDGNFELMLPRLQKWLNKFSDIPLIIVHGYPQRLLRDKIPKVAVDLVKDHDVYLEVLPGVIDYGEQDEDIRTLYYTFGPSKMVWGSECASLAPYFPLYSAATRYSQQLHFIETKCDYMSAKDIESILGENVRKIFRL